MLGIIMLAVVSVIAWILSTSPLGTLFTVVAASVQVWLLSHGAPVSYDGGSFGFVPWLVTALPIWLCYRAGRRLTIAGGITRARRKAARTGTVSRYFSLISWVCMAVVYGAIALATSAAMGRQPLPTHPWQAAGGAFLVALIAGGVGVLRLPKKHRNDADDYPQTKLRAKLVGLVGEGVVDFAAASVRAVLLCTGIILAAGFVLVVVTIIVHHHQFAALYGTLGATGTGAIVLSFGQLLALPNLVVWASSWMTGPGFVLGTGSSISPFGTTIGPIPAVPVLAGIPTDAVDWAGVFVVVPALAGLAAGWWMLAKGIDAWPEQLIASASIGVGTGVLLGVLGGLSGGPVGPGLLMTTGPHAVQFALIGAAGAFVGAALALLAGPRIVPTSRKAAEQIASGARSAERKFASSGTRRQD
ncbi:DUF6350 family protein [Spelaeicoccus albus]